MLGYTFNDGGRAEAGRKGNTAGDCVVRSLAILTGRPYADVYKAAADLHAEMGGPRSGIATNGRRTKTQRGLPKTVSRKLFEQFGLIKHSQADQRPRRRTLTEAHERYGDCIVSTAKHVFAIVGGAVQDTWDVRRVSFVDEWGGEVERERKAMTVWTLGGAS